MTMLIAFNPIKLMFFESNVGTSFKSTYITTMADICEFLYAAIAIKVLESDLCVLKEPVICLCLL